MKDSNEDVYSLLLSLRSKSGFYGFVLVSLLFVGGSFGYIDLTIEGPSTVTVGETFIISGTSRQEAAERVNLYLLDLSEPVAHAVVGMRPPFTFEFEVSVSSDGLNVNGETIYSGPTKGKVFHFFLRSHNFVFNESPLLSVTIE